MARIAQGPQSCGAQKLTNGQRQLAGCLWLAKNFIGFLKGSCGPRCPKCATTTDVSRFQAIGKTGKSRRLYQCGACRHQFSATAGTLFHDSHLPLTDWLLVLYLMDSSKMRISAKEVERMLGISYETAWRMCDRIRSAMEKADQKDFLQRLIGVG